MSHKQERYDKKQPDDFVPNTAFYLNPLTNTKALQEAS